MFDFVFAVPAPQSYYKSSAENLSVLNTIHIQVSLVIYIAITRTNWSQCKGTHLDILLYGHLVMIQMVSETAIWCTVRGGKHYSQSHTWHLFSGRFLGELDHIFDILARLNKYGNESTQWRSFVTISSEMKWWEWESELKRSESWATKIRSNEEKVSLEGTLSCLSLSHNNSSTSWSRSTDLFG